MILLILVTSLFAGQSDGEFDEFFKEFSLKRDGINALEATYEQKMVTPDETFVVKGQITYVQPKRIVLRYKDEGTSTVILLDNSRGYEYDEELKQLQIFDIDEDPGTSIFFLGFDNDTKRLREAYDVNLFDPGNGDKGITLIPKKADADSAVFQSVRLFLRKKDYLPYQIEIQNDEESSGVIKVDNFVINKKETVQKAFIDLPEGTKIITNREYTETVGPGGKKVPEKSTTEKY